MIPAFVRNLWFSLVPRVPSAAVSLAGENVTSRHISTTGPDMFAEAHIQNTWDASSAGYSRPQVPPPTPASSSSLPPSPLQPPPAPASFGEDFDIGHHLSQHKLLALNQLQLANPHPLDASIAFSEKDHVYTFQGRRVQHSVTEVVGSLCESFDPTYAVELMKKSRNWPRPDYSSRDGTPWTDEQILQFWDGIGTYARNRGTWMHYNIERYFNGCTPATDSPEISQFFNFHRDVMAAAGIQPWRTEWRICDPSRSLAGSVDFVGRLPDGTFCIVDWKRSKKVSLSKGKFGKNMRAPLEHLDDSDSQKYFLQLNVYRHILQTLYDVPISRMMLGVFHPTLPAYQAVEVPLMDREVRILLDFACGPSSQPKPHP
jgi:hypothetical protein